MATEQKPVWIRQYLRNLGATDDEIGYQDGVVTYKNQPFYYGTPNAEGRVEGNQSDFDSAYASYSGREARQQATAAQQQAQTNRQQSQQLLSDYRQSVSQARQPFSYNMEEIRASPEYQAGLAGLQQDAERATNQSLVNLGRRGIGNSQSAVTTSAAQQQNVVNQANNVLAPRLIAERYQRYMDEQTARDRDLQAQRDLIGLYGSEADRADLEAGRYLDRANNIAAADQERLAGLRDYELAQQEAAAAAEKAQIDRLWQAAEQIGTLPPALAEYYGLPDGTTTLEAERVGISRASAAAADARSREQIAVSRQNASTAQQNAALAQQTARDKSLFDVWERTGYAPRGLESYGVREGDPLRAASSTGIDAKTSSDGRMLLEADLNTPGVTYDEAIQLLQANRNNLTDADYRALAAHISKVWGDG